VAVDLFHDEFVHGPALHHVHEGSGCGGEDGLVLREHQQRLAATFDIQHQRAVNQHHERTGFPSRTVPAAGFDIAGGPRQGGAVGVGRVGCREGQRQGLRLGQLGVLGVRTQPVDGCGHGELRGTEMLDEVSPPAAPGFLQPGKDLVH
jgi:hypothetical protein